MRRVRHLLDTLHRNFTGDPASRGAAKMAAGGVLIAEGLFGVVSSTANPFDGGRKFGGLVAATFGILFGVVFTFVGFVLAAPDVPADEVVITGQVVAVETSQGDDGTMYSAVYGYTVDDRTYELHSSLRSSSRPSIGKPVEIGYSATEPANARRVDGMDGKFHLIFAGVGLLILAIAGVHGLISLAMIFVGIKLVRSGRTDRAAAGVAKEGFVKDLFDLFQSRAGASGPDLFGTLASVTSSEPSTAPPAAATPAVTASGPPAGWYLDPQGSGLQRWWDGTAWTDHTQAPPAS